MNKYFDILAALISWLNNILFFNQTNRGKDVLTEVLIQGDRTGKTLNRNMAHKLRELIHEGNIKEIKKMVSNNKNILYADMVDHQKKKTNPLIEAVVTGNEDIVKFFLKKDTWLVNQTKPQPPLFYCINKPRLKDPIFDILLKHTDLNERFGNSKWTPLMYAIHKKNYEAFRKILEQENLDMKKKDGAGNTALHYAACKDSMYLVLLCYFKTVDFNEKNENGQKANQPLPGVTEKNKEWLKKFEEAGNDKTKKKEIFDQFLLENRKRLEIVAPAVNVTVRDVDTLVINQTNTCRGMDEENNTPVSNDNHSQSRTINGNGQTSMSFDSGRSYPPNDNVSETKNSTDLPSYEDAIQKSPSNYGNQPPSNQSSSYRSNNNSYQLPPSNQSSSYPSNNNSYQLPPNQNSSYRSNNNSYQLPPNQNSFNQNNSTVPPHNQRSFNQSTLQEKPVELLLPRKNMRDIMEKPIFSH